MSIVQLASVTFILPLDVSPTCSTTPQHYLSLESTSHHLPSLRAPNSCASSCCAAAGTIQVVGEAMSNFGTMELRGSNFALKELLHNLSSSFSSSMQTTPPLAVSSLTCRSGMMKPLQYVLVLALCTEKTRHAGTSSHVAAH